MSFGNLDILEQPLDLNELLIKRKASTYFLRATSKSMSGIGIYPGDMLITDRSKTAFKKAIVVAVLDGGFIVRRYISNSKGKFLISENSNFKTIKITEGLDLEIWGVVTSHISFCI